MALRAAGSRHGVLMTEILSGLLSSTAATVQYARRSNRRLARRALWPLAVTVGAGGAAFALG